MSNIKSFNELGGGDSGPGSDGDDGGDGFNDYYAGGEKSGQLIRGAPKKDDPEDADQIAALFEKAKRSGAAQGTAEDLQGPSRAFQGSGRTLAGGTTQAPQGPLKYTIAFYENNIFTVNDGPPRSTTDPANRQFIEAIEEGVCPEELEPQVPGTPITVNLVRKQEDYEPPAKPRQVAAFQGTGRTLASGSGSGAGGSAAPAPPPAAPAGEWEGVNESLPTTSLQLRLADGSRLVARFNHSHRISDIRRFIRSARPDITWGYSLMTGVPPSVVQETEDLTLEAAGLLNSVLIQKK